MRPRLRLLLEVVGLAAAVTLAMVSISSAVAPAAEDLGIPPTPGATGEATLSASTSSVRPSLAPATRVAGLFPLAPRPPVTPTPPAPEVMVAPTPEPAVADWLVVVGNATEGTGRLVYFLKDKRTGSLYRATSSPQNTEWEVLATNDKYIEIKNPQGTHRVALP